MAFNWGQMFASLTILDTGTITDFEDVPHRYDPYYTPKYQLQVWNSEFEMWEECLDLPEGADIVDMVDEAHYGIEQYRLLEDGLPVFIRG